MVHWYFDEVTAVERMREVHRMADRAQALGLIQDARPTGRQYLRQRVGRTLTAIGRRLQHVETVAVKDLASSSQCGLR